MHVTLQARNGCSPLLTWPFPATLSYFASPADHAPDAARRADARLSGPSTEGPEPDADQDRPRGRRDCARRTEHRSGRHRTRTTDDRRPRRAPRLRPPHPRHPTTRPPRARERAPRPPRRTPQRSTSCARATPAASAMIPSASSALRNKRLHRRVARLERRADAASTASAPAARRSPPASPAATRRRTPATGSTASTSSRRRPGRASAAPATRPRPPRPSRTAAPRKLYAQSGSSPWPVCGQ